jgi:hypothetical protein
MLFRGNLPIMGGWQLAQFSNGQSIRYRELKTFLTENAERIKEHGVTMAERAGRPFQYLQQKVGKEEPARTIAARDGIQKGWTRVLSAVETCRTFSFRFENGKPIVASPRLLGQYAKRVNPLIPTLLKSMPYCRVTAQSLRNVIADGHRSLRFPKGSPTVRHPW